MHAILLCLIITLDSLTFIKTIVTYFINIIISVKKNLKVFPEGGEGEGGPTYFVTAKKKLQVRTQFKN